MNFSFMKNSVCVRRQSGIKIPISCGSLWHLGCSFNWALPPEPHKKGLMTIVSLFRTSGRGRGMEIVWFVFLPLLPWVSVFVFVWIIWFCFVPVLPCGPPMQGERGRAAMPLIFQSFITFMRNHVMSPFSLVHFLRAQSCYTLFKYFQCFRIKLFIN